MSDTTGRALTGAAAGFAASGPMAIFLEALFPLLPPADRYPPGPRKVTATVAESAGLDLSDDQKEAASMGAHFAYGSGAGAVYGLVAPHLPVPPAARGPLFAVGLWAAGYLGWLPATGLHPSAAEESICRSSLHFAGHLVWGAILGRVYNDLAGERKPAGAPRAAEPRPVLASVGE